MRRLMDRNSSSKHLRSPTYVKVSLDDSGMFENLPKRSRYEVNPSKHDSPTKTKSPRTSKLSPIASTGIERNLKDSGRLLNNIHFRDSKVQSEEMRTKIFMNMLNSGRGSSVSIVKDNQVAFREIGLMHGMNAQGLGLDIKASN